MAQANEIYNGWANYETWNVALYLDNDEEIYKLALKARSYQHFLTMMKRVDPWLRKKGTPDGIKWLNRKVDVSELDEYITKHIQG